MPDLLTPSPYRIESVYGAFRLLESLVASNRPLTAIQLSAMTGETRNRSFRVIKTLEELGYVIADPGSTSYRPTLRLFSLGHIVSGHQTVDGIARPIMERFRDEVNETVYLTVREGDEVVCLFTIESMRTIRITAQPGRRWPLGRGSAGQALLLATTPEEQERIIDTSPGFDQHWPAIKERYYAEGVSYVDGREGLISDEGVMALGVPVRDALGDAKYALSVAWPISRTNPDIQPIKAALRLSAATLERALGFIRPEHAGHVHDEAPIREGGGNS